MSAATQVYYASFDTVFSKLSPALQTRIEAKSISSVPGSIRFLIIG